jgi:hypothetical protein
MSLRGGAALKRSYSPNATGPKMARPDASSRARRGGARDRRVFRRKSQAFLSRNALSRISVFGHNDVVMSSCGAGRASPGLPEEGAAHPIVRLPFE